MRARPVVTGWCPSVPGVEGQPWWPGRFIFKAGRYTEDGQGLTRLQVLCPACGKWVPTVDPTLPDHELPKGSDLDRVRKVERARKRYAAVALQVGRVPVSSAA